MKVSEQERRLHDAQGHKLGLLAAALGAFAIAAAICNGAMPTPATPDSVWPTLEWRTSSPEEEGMDSKELAKLVDWGTTHNFDSLLVQRHGKIVAEAYYVSYGYVSLGARGPHQVYSASFRLPQRTCKWVTARTGSNSFSIGRCRALRGTSSTITVAIPTFFPRSSQNSLG